MGAKTAAAAVGGAALLGGGLRLLLFPQFVLGLLLLAGSVVLKLSRNVMGVLIIAGLALVGLVFVALFNDRMLRGLKRRTPMLQRQLRKAAAASQAATGAVLQATPPWALTLAGFSLPAAAQFLGSMGTVNMLLSLDARPPGAAQVTVFSLMYLATLTLGVSRSWLKPSKISFLLQSVWVVRALFSESGSELRFNQHLPSVLAGWGGFFLGMTPGTAVVAALKAGAASGAVAAAGVATVEGVKAGVKLARGRATDEDKGVEQQQQQQQQQEQDEEHEEHEHEHEHEHGHGHGQEEEPEGLGDVVKAWKGWFDEDRALEWAGETLTREKAWGAAREAFGGAQSTVRTWVAHHRRGGASTAAAAAHRKKDDDFYASDGDGDDEFDAEDDVARFARDMRAEGDALDAKEDLEEAGFDVNDFTPPMQAAAAVTLFRATPTLLTLLLGSLVSLASLASGKMRPGALAIPVLLAPFAFGEVAALVQQVGLRNLFRGGLSSGERQEQLAEKYPDGMSLLLWQSPQMLRAWQSVASWNDALNSDRLFDEVVDAPRQYLRPSEDTIKAAPSLSFWIASKLLFSLLIDGIGSSSYAVPALGELSDFAWAPISGYIVHHLYGLPLLSWLGVVEEILPFTDFIPTAVIGWLYMYGAYLPVWAVRGARKASSAVAFKPPSLGLAAPSWSVWGKSSSSKRRSKSKTKTTKTKRASKRGSEAEEPVADEGAVVVGDE